MTPLPNKLYVKRGDVRAYLDLSESAMTKLIENRVLKPRYFPGMTQAVFERAEVLKVKPEEKNSTTETQRTQR